MGITPGAEIGNIKNPSDITLTPRPKTKVKFSATTSNYVAYKDLNDIDINNGGKPELENIFTLRAAVNLPVLEGATLSADIGGDFNTKYDIKLDRHKETKSSPIVELKYKQNFGGPEIAPNVNLNVHAGARARITYEPDKPNEFPIQTRLYGGMDLKLGRGHSIYIDGHYTPKYNKDAEWETKYGGWIGYSYKNFWIEEQLNSDGKFSTNVGISFSF